MSEDFKGILEEAARKAGGLAGATDDDAKWRKADAQMIRFDKGAKLSKGWEAREDDPGKLVVLIHKEREFPFVCDEDGKWKPFMDAGDHAGIDGEAWRSVIFDVSARPKKGIDRILGDIFAKGFMTVLAGAGGSSKSTIMATLALGVASDRNIVGPQIKKPGKVLYLGLEDDQDMIDRMFHSIKEEHGIHEVIHQLVPMGDDTIRRTFKFRDHNTFSLLHFNPAQNELEVNTQLLRKLKTLIMLSGAGIVVIDPLAVLYGGVQMSNEAMNLLARALKKLSQDTGTAIVAISHTRKASSNARKGGDQNDIKHGGELVDTARCAININELPDDLKTKWLGVRGMDMDELNSVRFALTTKTNIGKKGRRFYYIIKEHSILCEDGKTETVGVVHPWSPPNIIDVADMSIWPMVRERLEKDFVYASPNGSSQPKLKNVIEEIGGEHNGTKVAQAYIDRGMIEIVEDKSPKGGKDPVKRAVVGPNGYDD